jgi:hypothetical protein
MEIADVKGPLIYMLTFPSGKKYIGQTTGTFLTRTNAHRRSSTSNNPKVGCRLLKRAIREHGWDNISREVLAVCRKDQLNEYEIKYIFEHNSLVPNGYNLTGGGSTNKKVSNETRKLQSIAQHNVDSVIFRRSEESKKLPRYLHKLSNKVHVGYSIRRHPNGSTKFFSSKYKTDEENFQDAMDHLEKLNKGKVEDVKDELPKGIRKELIGYRVCVKDRFIGNYNKRFSNSRFIDEENLNNAMNYLKKIRCLQLKPAILELNDKLKELMILNNKQLEMINSIENSINELIKRFND